MYVNVYADNQSGSGSGYDSVYLASGASSATYLDNGYFSSGGTTGYHSRATLLPGGDSHPGTNLTLLQDDDGDTVANTEDNCPDVANGNQENFDDDELGDDCDPDDDNDGVPDADEGPLGTDPFDPDFDNDGIRDGLDVNPTGFDNSCSGEIATLNQLISWSFQCAAPTKVIIGSDIIVQDAGDLRLVTPVADFIPGFRIEPGGEISVHSESLPTP